ncbi:flagellar hook-basal body complex protein FliE [Virgibacillus sp. MSJ-26]|uniref:flagellar hook-basal body complex protein FliE n=1 Tax=Virgibacillus sp. MSJ-26 TaxID=2841522 RepID=UPI001C0F402B|nr:flagellar hook-basal body complex protein FliE [Virgibacillus sp. MSJ-26]MBU5466782.1 flagellar hook-basal body complex protein FliE [Virgibacillus sp. MSJ-26]
MNSYINEVTSAVNNGIKLSSPANKQENNQGKFANVLEKAITDVNKSQVISNQKTEALASGQIDDLHDVMISAQKASVTLETSVQIQKKVIDAYNEIMRMQV